MSSIRSPAATKAPIWLARYPPFGLGHRGGVCDCDDVPAPFGDVRKKWRPRALSELLRDPATTYPDGRMPSLGLSDSEADLLATIENTTNLDLLDSSEVILADPGMQATSVDGRRIIEDQDAGYTVSFDEKWSQYPSNPAEGYVLSLGFGAEEILASVDVFMIYDWDPQFSAFDLASVIDPTADGAVTGPLETVQIGGQSGLMRTYEMVDMGVRIIGSQHILVQGDRAAVIILWAVD